MSDLANLQTYWWMVVSLLGAFLVFMMFVQGGQALILRMNANDRQKKMIFGSLGHKWGTTFTTLVTFGGAAFASFPLFYSTSFGGAYWLWLIILILFVLQAFSFEFRDKLSNLLGTKTYDAFLILNGIFAPILLGVAVATLYSGGAYYMDKMNIVNGASNATVSYWANDLHGLDLIPNQFNLLLGLVLLFCSMTLGMMYFMYQFDIPLKTTPQEVLNAEFGDAPAPSAEAQAKRLAGAEAGLKRERADRDLIAGKAYRNFVPCACLFLVLFIVFVIDLCIRTGYGVAPDGSIFEEHSKYFHNMTQLGWPLVVLIVGTVLVLVGVSTRILKSKRYSPKASFYTAGLGVVMAVWALLCCAALNNTAFFPSTVALQDSLTLKSASSSLMTLKVMTCVSFFVPVVIAYIGYCWHKLAGVTKGY